MSVVGEKLKRKKTTAADLPEEIVRKEILTRLPIKNVVRFKSVSKSWLSLFSDPQFVIDHFTHCSTQNSNDYDCVIAKKNNIVVILSRYKETFALHCDNFHLIGSVRGLVCLCSGQKLSLWNPAIHQSKEFYLPPLLSRAYSFWIRFGFDCVSTDYIGFGFDPVSNDYKVVDLSSDLRSATVYYSSSDSWIDISVPDLVFLKSRRSHYVIVKDCPYWIFVEKMKHEHQDTNQLRVWTAVSLISVKFDTGSNDFKLLPEFNFDIKEFGTSYEFVDMNDCLTMMVLNQFSFNFVVDIYSLDGEEEGCHVWSKMYSMGPIISRPQDCYVSLSQGFKYGGEIVYHDDRIFCCYDNKTDTIKHLVSTSTPATFSVINCFRYTPSLVFLEGMKSVHLKTRTRHTPTELFSN